MIASRLLSLREHPWLGRAVVLVLAALAVVALTPILPHAVDWDLAFYPATRALLSGSSPYDVHYPTAPYAGAPWGLLLLAPFAALPLDFSRAAFFVAGFAGFAWAAHRLGADRVTLPLFLVSPPVLFCLYLGNTDWLPLLAMTLPPQYGLFLLALKPQVGLMVGLWWLVETWREAGFAAVVRTFGPVTLAALIGVVLFPDWVRNILGVQAVASQGWNTSFWPFSLPLGLGLTWLALRRRDQRYALAASPCLSPYVGFNSWSVAVAAILRDRGLTAVVVAGLWVLLVLLLLTGNAP